MRAGKEDRIGGSSLANPRKALENKGSVGAVPAKFTPNTIVVLTDLLRKSI